MKYESATLPRNQMDHLREQIPNLAKSKVARPPVFGVLSFLHAGADDIQIDEGEVSLKTGRIVVINPGTFTHGHEFKIVNPGGKPFYSPVGALHFAAYDEVLMIDEMVDDLEPIFRHIETSAKSEISEGLATMAESENLPLDKLMGHAAADTVFVLEITFGKNEDAAPKKDR